MASTKFTFYARPRSRLFGVIIGEWVFLPPPLVVIQHGTCEGRPWWPLNGKDIMVYYECGPNVYHLGRVEMFGKYMPFESEGVVKFSSIEWRA